MSAENYFDLLRLSFLLPPGYLQSINAQDFLNLLKQNFPLALPFSWFQIFYKTKSQVQEDGARTFIETWEEASLSNGNPGFYWGSKTPFLDGLVRFGGSWPQQSYYALSPDLVELQFDQSQINREALTLIPEIIRGFKEIARSLQAFYAAGYVLRNYSLEDGSITFVIDVTETVPTYTSWWQGIPKTPWLTWFGTDYKSLLNDSLSTCNLASEATDDGCLLILDQFPIYNNKAKKLYPPFPKDCHSSLALTHKLAERRSQTN